MEKLMKTAVPWELQTKLVGGVGLNTFGQRERERERETENFNCAVITFAS